MTMPKTKPVTKKFALLFTKFVFCLNLNKHSNVKIFEYGLF